jgi:hypothetical protein
LPRPAHLVLGLAVAALAVLGYRLVDRPSTRPGQAGVAGPASGPGRIGVPRFEEPAGDVEAPLDELEIERRISHRLHQGPVRPELAAPLVSAISGAMDDLVRETRGRVGGIDCRGDGCVVEVDWASTESAIAQKEALLAAGARLNCQPRFGVRPGPDASGRAFLFLDGCRGFD